MPKLTLVYISLSGNTQSFVKRLSEQLSTWHNCQVSTINIKEQNHQTFPVDQPFVALLPKNDHHLIEPSDEDPVG